ncbi:MAG: DegV family protein [Candidatus Bipolaricaulota bacterium]|nr:DegV family protein [Candidatus Bipolaricaulota bacterium]
MTRDGKIRYLSGERLRQAVIAGAYRVISSRELLDRINVFPVPDSDTGSNLAATMREVIQGLKICPSSPGEVSARAATCALAGARGNSGVIMAQFFQGLREGIPDKLHISVLHFVQAAKTAAVRTREALATPQEGTILTVISNFADHVAKRRERLGDFVPLLEGGLRAAQGSLAQTRYRLSALRNAGVVDAGALGFVRFLEGFVEFLKSGEVKKTVVVEEQGQGLNIAPDYIGERVDFRYCTEGTISGEKIDRAGLKERLVRFGDSVVVAGTDRETHAHIHTNAPANALEIIAQAGKIQDQKVEDMFAGLKETATDKNRSGIALVTDSVCDLPQSFLTSQRIHVIPLQVAFGEEEFLDRVQITPNQFYARLANSKILPKTSQPHPADFLLIYRYLVRHYASILSIHLSPGVSGTYQLALTAARPVTEESGVPIEVVDSRSASAAQGLVVWVAANAINSGASLEECAAAARAAAARANVFVFVPTLVYFVRGGRLSPLQGKIGELLHLKPILTTREGKVAPAGKAIGRRHGIKKTFKFVYKLAKKMHAPAFVVTHSAAPELAQHYSEALHDLFPGSVVMVAAAAPALGSHAGPGGAAIAVLDTEPIDQPNMKEKG